MHAARLLAADLWSARHGPCPKANTGLLPFVLLADGMHIRKRTVHWAERPASRQPHPAARNHTSEAIHKPPSHLLLHTQPHTTCSLSMTWPFSRRTGKASPSSWANESRGESVPLVSRMERTWRGRRGGRSICQARAIGHLQPLGLHPAPAFSLCPAVAARQKLQQAAKMPTRSIWLSTSAVSAFCGQTLY